MSCGGTPDLSNDYDIDGKGDQALLVLQVPELPAKAAVHDGQGTSGQSLVCGVSQDGTK
jgi:hypothetical protein